MTTMPLAQRVIPCLSTCNSVPFRFIPPDLAHYFWAFGFWNAQAERDAAAKQLDEFLKGLGHA